MLVESVEKSERARVNLYYLCEEGIGLLCQKMTFPQITRFSTVSSPDVEFALKDFKHTHWKSLQQIGNQEFAGLGLNGLVGKQVF